MFIYEWLVALFLVTKRGYSYTFDCLEINECWGQTFNCPDDEICYINCMAGSSCRNSIVNCPDGPYDCIITSNGGCASCTSYVYGSSQGGNLIINAGGGDGPHFPYVTCPSNGGHCNLTQTDGSGHGWGGQSIITTQPTTELLYIHVTGFYALAGASIYCPKRHIGGFENNCIVHVFGGGSRKMQDTKIYAIESFTDIDLRCDSGNCGNNDGRVTMYCTEDYSESCILPLGVTVYDQCEDTSLVCNDYTLMPTSYEYIFFLFVQ